MIRKRKLVSISQQKILILAVDKIVVPCQQDEMDAVHAQTRLKACEALIHLVKRADTAERFTRLVDAVTKFTRILQPQEFCKLRHKECYLVDVAAMTRLCVRRTFTLVIQALNSAIKYGVWPAALTFATSCHQTYLQNARKSSFSCLIVMLDDLSEADDDLIETLLGLAEIELRLGLSYEEQTADIIRAIPILVPESSSSLSLSLILFIWFLLHCTCSDPSVLFDMLLNPETRALEYCLRGSKALLTGQSVESLILHIEFLNDGIGESALPRYSKRDGDEEALKKVAVWQTSDEHERILPRTWQPRDEITGQGCEQMYCTQSLSSQSLADYCQGLESLLSKRATLGLLASRFASLHALLSSPEGLSCS